MFHNTPVIDRVQKVRKIKQNSKTPGDLHGCPTRGVGRTPTMFHNTLVVGSSPTSSTTQSPETGEFLLCRKPFIGGAFCSAVQTACSYWCRETTPKCRVLWRPSLN